MDWLSTLKEDAETISRTAAAELTRAEAEAVSSYAGAEQALKPLQAEVADLQQQLSDAVSASGKSRPQCQTRQRMLSPVSWNQLHSWHK